MRVKRRWLCGLGVALSLLCLLGYGLKRFDWPRPPFVIGLVLGGIAEVSFHQALAIWGPAFFLRPISLILLALIIASIGFYFWRRARAGGSDHVT